MCLYIMVKSYIEKSIKLNVNSISTLINWMYRISIIAYLRCSEVNKKYILLGAICLLLPSSFSKNLVLLFICLFEINDNQYMEKYIILKIKAFKKHKIEWKKYNNETDNSNSIDIYQKLNNY